MLNYTYVGQIKWKWKTMKPNILINLFYVKRTWFKNTIIDDYGVTHRKHEPLRQSSNHWRSSHDERQKRNTRRVSQRHTWRDLRHNTEGGRHSLNTMFRNTDYKHEPTRSIKPENRSKIRMKNMISEVS